jgi:hypothetical protein
MTLLRLDRIITSIGLTIGISIHLYLAFLAAANSFPFSLLLESEYHNYTGLAVTEPFTVSRQLDMDVGIGVTSNQGFASRKLSVQQKTDPTVFVNTYDLKQAVDLWIADKARAQGLYGHISDWNVSAVTDMSLLFRGAAGFSEDLSQWDVSLVSNMSGLFHDARQFQSNLSYWQVANVKDFSHMFHGAVSFDGDVSTWNVSSAVDYSFMFCNATTFQGDLLMWMTVFNKHNYIDYSYSSLRRPIVPKESRSFPHAQNMESMFENAISFDSDLTLWETGVVVNMRSMFRNATHFNGGDLRDWNVSAVRDFGHMFDGANSFSGHLCWRGTYSADTTGMLKGSPGSFNVDCDDDADDTRIIAGASFGSTNASAISDRWDTFTAIFAKCLEYS